MKGIKDIEIEDKVPSLENIVFNEFGKMGITPSNSEWRVINTLSSAIEEYIHLREQNYTKKVETWISDEYSKEIEWLCNEYAEELQNWLVEDFIPSFHKFNYWAAKEFPKTFNKMVHNENEDTEEENIEDAEYEEVYTND